MLQKLIHRKTPHKNDCKLLSFFFCMPCLRIFLYFVFCIFQISFNKSALVWNQRKMCVCVRACVRIARILKANADCSVSSHKEQSYTVPGGERGPAGEGSKAHHGRSDHHNRVTFKSWRREAGLESSNMWRTPVWKWVHSLLCSLQILAEGLMPGTAQSALQTSNSQDLCFPRMHSLLTEIVLYKKITQIQHVPWW